MKFKVYKYKSLTSTNDEAISCIKDKKINFGFIFAQIQTKGRGTKGNKWISLKGNLFGSIFFPLKENYPTFHEFTFITPIIIYDVIKSFCINSSLSLKWPNDILMNKKKICGILQEIVQKNGIKYLIVGVGLNLVKSPNIQDYPTTNLLELTGTKINVNKASKQLIIIYKNFLKSQKVF